MIAISLGLLLDLIIGDPRGWPHPVIWIGKVIDTLEGLLYKKNHRKLLGGVLVVCNLAIISVLILGIRFLLAFNPYVLLFFDVIAIASAMAYKSLMGAGKLVLNELKKGDLQGARREIAMFVSRDTAELTEEQVAKTLIETLSENLVDGILAPLMFCIVGQVAFGQGVLFIWLYKGINTMDSMIAYKNDQYMDFGYVAAKLDDVANWLPARLSALAMLLAGLVCGMDVRRGFKVLLKDHGNSASPNAGYPESVVAGLLGIQLGGPYAYFGQLLNKPTIGEPIETVTFGHIKLTQKIGTITYLLIAICVVALAVI